MEGLDKGALGSKALRRGPQALRKVQHILRIPEDALNLCTALTVVQGGVFEVLKHVLRWGDYSLLAGCELVLGVEGEAWATLSLTPHL